MTTANHLLVGTLIGLTIKQPALALPIAFASHFVLDALPHYGYNGDGYGEALKHKTTLVMEALGITGFIALLMTGIYGLNLPTLAAFVAVSPDLEWPYRYFRFETKGEIPGNSAFTRFHKKIQWGERKWGIFIEVPFFIAGYLVLISIT